VCMFFMAAEVAEHPDDAGQSIGQTVDVSVSRFSSVLEMIAGVSTVSHGSTIVFEGEKQAAYLPTSHPRTWN